MRPPIANRLQDLERAVVTPEFDGPRVRVCLSDRHRAGFVPPSQFWQREPVPEDLGPRRESIFTDEEGRMRIDRGRRIRVTMPCSLERRDMDVDHAEGTAVELASVEARIIHAEARPLIGPTSQQQPGASAAAIPTTGPTRRRCRVTASAIRTAPIARVSSSHFILSSRRLGCSPGRP